MWAKRRSDGTDQCQLPCYWWGYGWGLNHHRHKYLWDQNFQLNGPVSKTGVAFGLPWVRIPPSPLCALRRLVADHCIVLRQTKTYDYQSCGSASVRRAPFCRAPLRLAALFRAAIGGVLGGGVWWRLRHPFRSLPLDWLTDETGRAKPLTLQPRRLHTGGCSDPLSA